MIDVLCLFLLLLLLARSGGVKKKLRDEYIKGFEDGKRSALLAFRDDQREEDSGNE